MPRPGVSKFNEDISENVQRRTASRESFSTMEVDLTMALAQVTPLNVRNYQPNHWPDWLIQFKLNLRISTLEHVADQKKVALLLVRMGPEAMTIFKTFNVNVDMISFDQLIGLFDEYFTPVVSRQVFLNRCQAPGETFEQFVETLDILSGPCCFGPCKKSLVRDVFVKNMSDKFVEIRKEILKMGDPTLEDVVAAANALFYSNNFGLTGASKRDENNFHCGNARQNTTNFSSKFDGRGAYQKATQRQRIELPSTAKKYNVPPIVPNDEVQVTVMWVEMNEYYVVPQSWEAVRKEFYDALTSTLRQKSNNVRPEKDCKYCLIYQGEIHRVVVLSTNPLEDKVTVRCIDNGRTLTVSYGALRKTPLDFHVVEPLAVRVFILPALSSPLRRDQKTVMRFLEFKDQTWIVNLVDNEKRGRAQSDNSNFNNAQQKSAYQRETNSRNKMFSENQANDRNGGRSWANAQNRHSENGNSFQNGDCNGGSFRNRNENYNYKERRSLDGTRDTESSSCSTSTRKATQRASMPTSGSEDSSLLVDRAGDELAKINLENHPQPPIPYNKFTPVTVLYEEEPRLVHVCVRAVLDDISDMTRVLNDAYDGSTSGKPLENPSIGTKCAAPFDGSWYRAEIIALDEKTAKVKFIDFGNCEEIDVDKLMVLLDEIKNVEPLSFKIRVRRSCNVKVEDDIEIMPKKLNEKGAWLCEMKVNPNDKSSQNSSHLELIPTVVLNNCAEERKPSKHNRSSPKPHSRFTRMHVAYNGPEGTFVIPSDKMNEVARIVESVDDASTPCQNVVLDKIMVAPFEGTKYRAKVLSINRTNSTVQVSFIDFGNESSIPIDEMLELPEGVSNECFTLKIKVDPDQPPLEEGMDVNVLLVKQEPDGSWLVEVQNAPSNATSVCDVTDDFIIFSGKGS